MPSYEKPKVNYRLEIPTDLVASLGVTPEQLDLLITRTITKREALIELSNQIEKIRSAGLKLDKSKMKELSNQYKILYDMLAHLENAYVIMHPGAFNNQKPIEPFTTSLNAYARLNDDLNSRANKLRDIIAEVKRLLAKAETKPRRELESLPDSVKNILKGLGKKV